VPSIVMLVAVLFVLASWSAAAQPSTNPGLNWPAKPITLVVPFPAGSASDVVARILSPRLGELLKKQVIIENVAGAGGSNGALRVARAAPDGYQVAFGVTGTHSQNQLLYKQPPYDATIDFAPVGLIAEAPYMLITRPDYPAADLKQFIGHAKSNQSKLQYGSGGQGSGTHITCLLLNTAIGIEVTHVPYRSTSQAMPDLLAGRIDYLCDPVQTSLPAIQQKTVKAMAALSRERATVLPAVPSAHEQGLANFDASIWFALFFPKNTPAAIIRRLNVALSGTLDTKSVRERLEANGLRIAVPLRRTPDYLSRFVASEIKKYAGPIKASGATLEN
jgi:tripartite-type tricarboxylate transporter receptor subunit TctC